MNRSKMENVKDLTMHYFGIQYRTRFMIAYKILNYYCQRIPVQNLIIDMLSTFSIELQLLWAA